MFHDLDQRSQCNDTGEGRDRIHSCTYIMIPNYVKNKLRHKVEGYNLK